LASVLYITSLSGVQSLAIMATAAAMGNGWPGASGLVVVAVVLLLLVLAVTALSLGLAFALPGHIELLAVIFVANLPLLFASTALAPLSFMPPWLAWLAALNPLSFAIEPIRAVYNGSPSWSTVVLAAPYGSVTMGACLLVLAGLAGLLFLSISPLLRRKLG
ncbi:MAG: ABC transporter permease, partial [Cyanobacteria bacterium MAG IRC1_bin_28]|nr:ABC transporter permease [Cyanobacteria bacterium MAG IRC1_bin_28]